MPLLAEQERLVAQEQNLLNDSAQYGLTTYNAWTLLHDWGNIIIPSNGLLLINFQIWATGGFLNVRVKIGSNYVYTAYTTNSSATPFGAAIWLAAGTYDFKIEYYDYTSIGQGYFQYLQVGLEAFNDTVGSAPQTYSSGVSLTVPSRLTPVGYLQQATYLAQIYAVTSGASTVLNNIGQNQMNGVSIFVDGTQVNWGEIEVDNDGTHFADGGTSGKIAIPANVGVSHTITITKQNSNTVVTICVIASPWILPQAGYPGIPVDINFSQGSTLYCMLEAWYINPTKFAGVGAIHGVSFGTADDYYSSASGTDLVEFSYMMDIVDILNNNLLTYGLGGCIGVIAVDAR